MCGEHAKRITAAPGWLGSSPHVRGARERCEPVAQVGGIMGAKRTSDIIPMCHPIMISGVDIDISLCEERHSVEIVATTKCTGATGVEMEALTAVSVAALTVYDMCKAVQRDIEITDIRLLKKTGGKSGVFERK